jgi:hypothetical protein
VERVAELVGRRARGAPERARRRVDGADFEEDAHLRGRVEEVQVRGVGLVFSRKRRRPARGGVELVDELEAAPLERRALGGGGKAGDDEEATLAVKRDLLGREHRGGRAAVGGRRVAGTRCVGEAGAGARARREACVRVLHELSRDEQGPSAAARAGRGRERHVVLASFAGPKSASRRRTQAIRP